MAKKRMALFAALPLTIAVILGVLAMLPPGPGVTKANFDRIQDGMTLADVEEILGEGGCEMIFASRTGTVTIIKSPEKTFLWFGDGCMCSASVCFVDNRVTEKNWHEQGETILHKICRWLRLPIAEGP